MSPPCNQNYSYSTKQDARITIHPKDKNVQLKQVLFFEEKYSTRRKIHTNQGVCNAHNETCADQV